MNIIKTDFNYGLTRGIASDVASPTEAETSWDTRPRQPQSCGMLDATVLRRSGRRLAAGSLEPAKEEVTYELAPDHAAEPIKSMDDIYRISEYLVSNGRYRDNMLFIVGINLGLRVSDLRMLKFSDLIDDDMTFRDRFTIFEEDTRNACLYITIESAVAEAVTLYWSNVNKVDRKKERTK